MAPVYFDVNGTKIGILAATQIERLENPDTKGATENSPGVFRCFNETELNLLLEQIKQTKHKFSAIESTLRELSIVMNEKPLRERYFRTIKGF